ncbi:MAG: hypothetical protein ABI790_02940 [Betaproteobacteria bacterium]
MKIIWESRRASAQPGSSRAQFVIWDFVKMLAMAILGGLAVSIVAAGITLLLTGSAEARRIQKEPAAFVTKSSTMREVNAPDTDRDELAATPGLLWLGEGCEGRALRAIERDWQVRIDDQGIAVRVMQTYQLPAESAASATFHVRLIKGATLQRIAAQTPTRDWGGRLISSRDYERLTPADFREMSRNQILVQRSPRGTVMTSPIEGLASGELVTIEYVYSLAADTVGGMSALVLPLEAGDDLEGNNANLRGEPNEDQVWDPEFPSPAKADSLHSTRGAVWVEWIGRKPSRVLGLPADADLDIAASRIDGFSWSTDAIQRGARFHLEWAM